MTRCLLAEAVQGLVGVGLVVEEDLAAGRLCGIKQISKSNISIEIY